MNPRRRQRNGVRNRRPCVQNAGVIGRGLLVSPARRRLFTTAAKIADTFFLANAVMNDTMTQHDTDDNREAAAVPVVAERARREDRTLGNLVRKELRHVLEHVKRGA